MMSFQALLRDANGTPVDGPVTLSLTIVDSGGTQQDASGNGSIGPEDTFVVNGTATAGVVSIKYGPIAPSCFNGAERRLRTDLTSPALGQLNDVEITTPPAIAEQLNTPGSGNAALTVNANGRIQIGPTIPSTAQVAISRDNHDAIGIQRPSCEPWSIGIASAGMLGLAFTNEADQAQRLFLSQDGNVGIGTTTPSSRLTVVGGDASLVEDLYVRTGDLAIGASGFNYGGIGYGFRYTPIGDEHTYTRADFASRIDFYAGGFRFYSAPLGATGASVPWTERLAIQNNGRIKVGETSIDAQLALRRDDDGILLSFERTGLQSWWVGPIGTGGGGLAFANATTGGTVRLMLNQNGHVGIGTVAPAHPLQVGGSGAGIGGNGAHCTSGGNWVSTSDRNVKADVEPIESEYVLERVATLPIQAWRYTCEPAGVRHIGPMAQDFHAAFGLGESDKHIGMLDADGVALASIQALHRQLGERACEINELKSENAALKKRLERLEAAILSQPTEDGR